MPTRDLGGFEKVLRVGEGRRLKRLRSQAEYIGTLEPEFEALSDAELAGKTAEFRQRLDNDEPLDELVFEAFAAVREARKRESDQRIFDVQLMGGIVLHEGDIAEMKTGEGKTFVASLALYLNALTGGGCHLVTVNDYLAKRDAEWNRGVYERLGMTVGYIQNMMPFAQRKLAYDADVTYGTNSEFGFDYLRDNMAVSLESTVQRGHPYAIVDEVDSILIDEARTPLIISGEPETAAQEYYDFARIVRQLEGVPGHDLKKGEEVDADYTYDEKRKTVAPMQQEHVPLATITLQNYFRLYEKLAGMTGTAKTEEKEFVEIYDLHVVEIPTNVPVVRADENDYIFKTKDAKFNAVIEDIKERHEAGQPRLVGTIAVETSEYLAQMLTRAGIKHNVLNAKQHEREAEIIQDAGEPGAVTIATNMAGRGVDIKLGEGVREVGGLYVLGTERHEARRIDNQLRGRSGRQGDPGETRFYLSAQDDLVRLFAGDRIHGIMERFKIPDNEPMEAAILSRQIENAQKKVEEQNFVARKNVLKYDDVENATAAGDFEEEWDLEALVQQMRGLYGTDITVDELREEVELTREALIEEFVEDALETYEEKEQELGTELMRDVERYVILQVVDARWREHLDAMDYLRDGIHLRAMAQKDPLVEYRAEGHAMFESLGRTIREEVVLTLFHAQIEVQQPVPEPVAQPDGNLSYQHETAAGADVIAAAGVGAGSTSTATATALASAPTSVATQGTVVKDEHKDLGRNDPCWCGSGKKFKRCHGA